ncbi:proline-rich extensin-like protein EPR1 [Nicotiana tomentosiformis]|uniref:Leucine-rich repeat extensin-like protein 5 n=1 Tax=Nicotiana tabacum TaxID=4097 RepID=A0A1S3Y261_TOBAC|nr:PREDICTED: leucine-rich repeat extensin-like protein 5 [Nicotiana tabacum]XP_033511263.1 leucine-rich repeat extensin-like protein 5 [Nicotiana tomentosiformis]
MKTPSHHHSMLYVLSLLLCFAAFFIVNNDARKLSGRDNGPLLVSKSSEDIIESSEINGFDVYLSSEDSSNSGPYGVSSPFNLPPYDSLPPVPDTPPFCLNPPSPFTLQPPPSGGGPIVNLPPSPSSTIIPSPPQQYLPPIIIPNPPQYFEPSPPTTTVPTPTVPILSPPYYYEPSPPSYYVPISPPTGVFLPPVIYPPPVVPPPPHIAPAMALWCVAKPSVPDPIIQEAMNYACASGADCDQINPSGSCFQPNTLFAHASYAFNSYWQRTKVAGGTCEFGGTAMLVTVDPSYDGCQFVYN